MIQQLIYRRAEQGYRTVAVSDGLRGKGLAKRIESLSTLPSSIGEKRLGTQPVYARCVVEDGLVMLMTRIDPNGMRGSHMTHAWYVEPGDVPAFADGRAIATGAYAGEYCESSALDELPGVALEQLPGEDTAALGCEAASALFGKNEPLLVQFLHAVQRCGMPTAGRGFLGVCVLSQTDEDALTVQAYRLMEAVLRAYPLAQVCTVGYRTLWNKAEDNVRYPVFFATPGLIGAESSVPMNYVLFDLTSGNVRLPRNAQLKPGEHDAELAHALLSGDADRVRGLKREAEERIRREEEERRRAEEERIRREEEARRRAEEERIRREEEARRKAEEARRLYLEQQRIKAEEEERRRREAEEARRLYQEEQRRKAEEDARIREEEAARQRQLHQEYLRRKAENAYSEDFAAAADRQRAADHSLNEQRRSGENARNASRTQRQTADGVKDSLRYGDGNAPGPQAGNAKAAKDSVQRVDVLNQFLKDLHLHAVEIPTHELDRMVGQYMMTVVRGSGNPRDAMLGYAARLLKEIAATLRDKRDLLKPMEYIVVAKCAYSVADSIRGVMFKNPTDRHTRECVNAMATVDRQVNRPNSPANGPIGAQRRDKWFVYLSVLDGGDDREQLRSCVNVIRSIRDCNVNSMLELMQRELDQMACEMVERCIEMPPRSGERNGLFKRAVLAVLYARVKFNSMNRPVWDAQIVLGRRLTRALVQIGLQEPFTCELDRLIDEITF